MNIVDVVNACEKIDPDKIKVLCDLVNSKSNIVILGNGGSNAIASHISQDYTKKLKKRSFTFSDPSRLTCYINDYGMEQANLQFLKEFSDQDNDKNILAHRLLGAGNGGYFLAFTKKDSKIDAIQDKTGHQMVKVEVCHAGPTCMQVR